MRLKVLFVIANLTVLTVTVQGVNSLNDALVWTFGGGLGSGIDTLVTLALYFEPQFMKRGWFKYSAIPYNRFPEVSWVADTVNAHGALLEGGVQCANLVPHAGWPCAHPEDDVPPYSIPTVIYRDFTTRNADDTIYYIPNLTGHSVTSHASIANENWLTYCLWWAYEQIDAGANALEFDEISGAYRFGMDTTVAPEENPNDGYDDYALGTANLCTRVSLVCTSDEVNPMVWFYPTASASTNPDSAQNAFDGNPSTVWHSAVGDSHWLEIDFGRPRRVKQLYLMFPSSHVLTDFRIRYWDGTSWQDFTPPVSVNDNSDSIRSFLVDMVWTSKLRLESTDSIVYVAEFQAYGYGFRQFVLERFYIDSGWTPTDTRWESLMLVELSDTGQCPDGTMNTFNYRKYLRYHGWTKNPFGGKLTVANALNPPNPFFLIWFPGKYYRLLRIYFRDDPEILDRIERLREASFSQFRTKQLFWYQIVDSVRAYAASVGRNIYISYNGSWYRPDSVDYFIRNLGNLPSYPAPSPSDSQKSHLDARRVLMNHFRWCKRKAVEYCGKDLPMAVFLDFGHMGFPYYHIGGKDEPADERAAGLLTYMAEAYAAGVRFAIPLSGNESYYIWRDTLSDGRTVAEVIKPMVDFINLYGEEIYKNVMVSEFEPFVRVNGIVPDNGDTIEPSYVNGSRVAIAYTDAEDGARSYLHIINHNWDTLTHCMIPQDSVLVEIPVSDSCVMVRLISPDFDAEDTLDFSYENGTVRCTIPELRYYVVLVIDLQLTGTKENGSHTCGPAIEVQPNPFNGIAHIRYSVTKPCRVRLAIYDVTGRLVKRLVDKPHKRGVYSIAWDSTNDHGVTVGAGLYFVNLKVDGKAVETQKLLILK